MQRAPASVLRPGELVAGRYRVEALIGQGGFGAVFRAMQLPMNRLVALKVVLPHAAANAEVRARFRRETELAQRLEHPNTVRLYDFGETDSGLPFIAWEHLRGRSLDAVLETEGPQDVGRAVRIGGQVLKSLMEAHAKGIIHRDIKPSNVFLCDFSGERDFVKVLDFGIAKAADGQNVTRGGTLLGTPAYMSPEQVSGGAITAASDTYALGLVLAEIISGRPAFAGDAPLAIAMAQLSDEPVPLPPRVVESPLGPLIVRATQKPVERRFGTAEEMLAALDAIEGYARASRGSLSGEASAAATTSSARSSDPSSGAGDETEGVANAPTIRASAAPASDGEPSREKSWSIIPPTRDDPTLLRSETDASAGAIAGVATNEAPPAPRARSFAVVVGILGALVALTIVIALSSGPAADPSPHEHGDDARSHGDRAARGHRLASLTAHDVRARFERLGCHVATETRGGPPYDTVLTGSCNGESTTLLVAHYESGAAAAETGMAAEGYTVLRDGNTLLAVIGPRNPKKIIDAFR